MTTVSLLVQHYLASLNMSKASQNLKLAFGLFDVNPAIEMGISKAVHKLLGQTSYFKTKFCFHVIAVMDNIRPFRM